jgi:crotonobetainyl-CoA:carnitine CoA-transferase CaiB-like acyl-CoA transferase
MAGLKPKLYGNSHGNLAPYANFPTKGRNIVIGAGNDGQFRKLTQMLGKPELADDPRFKTNKDRVAHRDALEAELRALTKDRDGEAFANELMQNGVPSGAVMEVPDVMEHPHTKHRGMVWEKDGWRNVGNPVKLSRTPAAPRSKPRTFGADTRKVLAEVGYSPAEIDKLLAAGVAFTEIRK